MNAIETYKASRTRYLAAEEDVRDAESIHDDEGTDETALLLTMAREEFADALLAYRKAFRDVPFEQALTA